jgi:hypothetical protein
MNSLKTFYVRFESDLGKGKVPAFRGAMIEKVGRDNMLFHNHKSDTDLYYNYPLIQYKSVYHKPALFCIGQGVEAIQAFFLQKTWQLTVNGEKMDLQVAEMELKNYTPAIIEKPMQYRLQRWLALNAENVKNYQSLNTLTERSAFLERLITGNILSFAKGIGWTVEKPIVVNMTEIERAYTEKYKGVVFKAFDVAFNCNVKLPQYIGLGKSASHGYGIVTPWRKKVNYGKTDV